MNNFVLHGRSAATATVAAMILAGHATQARAPGPLEVLQKPIVRFNFVEGSAGIVTAMAGTSYFAHAEAFQVALNAAYEGLAHRQQRLESGIARALAENAWDLYEEA